MRRDTRQRKKALVGLTAISGKDGTLGTLVRVISSGKQALDALMLEMGRMVAESVMLLEREEVAGPDYDPIDPRLQKWAHEEGSAYIGDQKVKVKRPRLRADYHTHTRKLDSPVLAGDNVGGLRAAVHARERRCRDGSGHRDYRSRACDAAVRSNKAGCVRTTMEPLKISTDLLTTSGKGSNKAPDSVSSHPPQLCSHHARCRGPAPRSWASRCVPPV